MPIFTQPEEEQLYLAVKRFLLEGYEPTMAIPDATRMTTEEIYLRLQEHMPGPYYSKTDVSHWMVEGGFSTFTVSRLRMEWVMKKRA